MDYSVVLPILSIGLFSWGVYTAKKKKLWIIGSVAGLALASVSLVLFFLAARSNSILLLFYSFLIPGNVVSYEIALAIKSSVSFYLGLFATVAFIQVPLWGSLVGSFSNKNKILVSGAWLILLFYIGKIFMAT